MITTTMIEHDEAVGATANSYHYTRVVEIAGRIVRARIERDFYINQSLAVAEVLNGQMTWTNLAADPHPATGGTIPQRRTSTFDRAPSSHH